MAVDDHLIHLENGILHADSPRSKIDTLIGNALAERASGPLVVHFHGGLVSYSKGREVAERLVPVYREAGGYPVFFLWESGLLETIRNNLSDIAREKIFAVLWERIRAIVERKLLQVVVGPPTIAPVAAQYSPERRLLGERPGDDRCVALSGGRAGGPYRALGQV